MVIIEPSQNLSAQIITLLQLEYSPMGESTLLAQQINLAQPLPNINYELLDQHEEQIENKLDTQANISETESEENTTLKILQNTEQNTKQNTSLDEIPLSINLNDDLILTDPLNPSHGHDDMMSDSLFIW